MTYYSEKEARTLVREAGLKLMKEGLVSRTWGNISARISEDSFIITPSGLPYERLRDEDMVKVSVSKCEWDGDIKPSSEKGVHAEVYKHRPEAHFVIHTHQFYASAVGVGGRTEGIPCAGYGLPGTKTLRKAVAATIVAAPEADAILMLRHGALCFGKSPEEAFSQAHSLEERCRKIFEDKTGIEDSSMLAFTQGVDGGPSKAVSPAITVIIERTEVLKPYLDDFAQLVGTSAEILSKTASAIVKGASDAILSKRGYALCFGEDARAVAEVLVKNCAAALYANAIGGARPLAFTDALLQRVVYKKKYSALAKKGSEDRT